ncbi:baseplate J/gp47 family protein [Pyxidicoccus trucidator]|uniref:baseplate J/gp47 family protein n=1 Tax=Pyxidicoccus trucidator TaxID=2709662 RepID=UPI0013D92130|nr:baseplate J/gp47 family protein [Pyxidicoccus trucidator]
MSYAAEPYAQFVEDLLLSLTGGVARERFVFLPENAPFRLSPPGPVVPSTLSVFGQVDGDFYRFVLDTDFTLDTDGGIEWLASPDGTPAADAVWPDEGTAFFANYDHRGPSGAAPRLNDRNPGSVVRLLSESFAREYAVVSRQLEGVYEAGFLDTATGRDLDNLVRLVGLERRDRTFATGSVVFSRGSPAPADIFVPEGTRLSTAEPPLAEFETTEDRTLHRGSLSVEAPIRARDSGPLGVAPARSISVIHRPILGIESAANPQGTRLDGDPETDEALRARARRALETAGQGTVGALKGALATLPGVREKDILLEEDPLTRPGLVTVSVAAELTQALAERAVDLIESTRPVGVRVLHHLSVTPPPEVVTPSANLVSEMEGDPQDSLDGEGLFAPVVARVILVPGSARLSAQDRTALKTLAEETLRVTVADAGVGEAVVYNRVVAALMGIDGVVDAALELYPPSAPNGPRHRNVFPGRTRRPSVATKDGGSIEVRVAGELLGLEVVVGITLLGAGALGDTAANLDAARYQIMAQLRDGVGSLTNLTAAALRGLITPPETFTVNTLSYTGEYVTAGVRLNGVSPALTLTPQELAWIRNVKVTSP